MILVTVKAPKTGVFEKNGFNVSKLVNLTVGLYTDEKRTGQCPVSESRFCRDSWELPLFQSGMTHCWNSEKLAFPFDIL